MNYLKDLFERAVAATHGNELLIVSAICAAILVAIYFYFNG